MDSTIKDFEAAIAELETIVKKLEEGDLPLETSLKLFERGVQLSRFCHAQLEDAEKRIEYVLGAVSRDVGNLDLAGDAVRVLDSGTAGQKRRAHLGHDFFGVTGSGLCQPPERAINRSAWFARQSQPKTGTLQNLRKFAVGFASGQGRHVYCL